MSKATRIMRAREDAADLYAIHIADKKKDVGDLSEAFTWKDAYNRTFDAAMAEQDGAFYFDGFSGCMWVMRRQMREVRHRPCDYDPVNFRCDYVHNGDEIDFKLGGPGMYVRNPDSRVKYVQMVPKPGGGYRCGGWFPGDGDFSEHPDVPGVPYVWPDMLLPMRTL